MPLRPPASLSLRSFSTHWPPSHISRTKDWKHQIWISRSHDPYLNLSIEHYLLQHSHQDSVVLFLYINSPCVVIGRNQNPWLEAHLRIVGQSTLPGNNGEEKVIQLVRRRSGGGTVFHDMQNVNYSVICPTADFSRDRHAEMVTRAMRKFNPRARVNERHDIVLDQGQLRPMQQWPDEKDMHQTAFFSEEKASLKVSGSAFKLTKHRSLHHGTCLLASDLDAMGKCLRSEARAFLKARGVDSVRSPVSNLLSDSSRGDTDTFIKEVIRQFRELYGLNERADHLRDQLQSSIEDDDSIPEVRGGIDEIKSLDWTYRQTPQFILSSHAVDEDNRDRPLLPEGWPSSAQVYLKIRSGAITSSRISLSSSSEVAATEQEHFHQILGDKAIHEIADFVEILKPLSGVRSREKTRFVANWLNRMFGK